MQNRTSANIIGPDLNEYRGSVNYTLLATKTNYCYLRASGNGSGKFREDKKFVEYVQGLRNVGIKSGAYHYAVPSYDLTTADDQCDDFINVLQKGYGPGNYGDLFPVIDIEAPTDKSISTDALLNWVDRFRKRFERKTRRILMLYTGAFFIELYNNFYHSTKGFILSDMPLWIAMYPEIKPNPPYPRDQGGWTRWRMWQYTESGTIAGVNPPVDLNYGPDNLDLLTQPRQVKNFNAIACGRNIRLTWSPNTDVDLAGYNIFLNSNYVTTLGKNATAYTIELGPQSAPVEKYEVSIEAFDTDGDFSQKRSKSVVTFTRGISDDGEVNNESNENELEEFVPMLMEVNEEVKEDKVELEKETNENLYVDRQEEYVDPVDRLERRVLGKMMDSFKRNEEVNNSEKENPLYSDFVESNGEFDDKLYLKKLDDEIAYKRYYDEIRNNYEVDFYDIHEDEEEDEDYIYTDTREERLNSKCNCIENNQYDEEYKEKNCKDEIKKIPKYDENFNDNKELNTVKYPINDDNKSIDCPVCDSYKYNSEKNYDNDNYDVEKMKIKMKGYQALNEDYSNTIEDNLQDENCTLMYKDKYEGERRRRENKDNENNKILCNICTNDKENCSNCEYLIYETYLSNCDYGYKNNHDKKKNKHKNYDNDKHDKKKKKKHIID